jgi:hypothetical protein
LKESNFLFCFAVVSKRFEKATVPELENKEKLKTLLFSKDKESVVQGMSLVEQLDEEVYYDMLCTFLKEDDKGNWTLKEGLIRGFLRPPSLFMCCSSVFYYNIWVMNQQNSNGLCDLCGVL